MYLLMKILLFIFGLKGDSPDLIRESVAGKRERERERERE